MSENENLRNSTNYINQFLGSIKTKIDSQSEDIDYIKDKISFLFEQNQSNVLEIERIKNKKQDIEDFKKVIAKIEQNNRDIEKQLSSFNTRMKKVEDFEKKTEKEKEALRNKIQNGLWSNFFTVTAAILITLVGMWLFDSKITTDMNLNTEPKQKKEN